MHARSDLTAGTALGTLLQAVSVTGDEQVAEMVSRRSSECSTDFEASAGSAATAGEEQQYDDDDFDDYSDSFESDNDAAEPDAAAASIPTGLGLLKVGTRVQVFWKEESEWFEGVIRSVEEGNEPRYYVHYDDGERQWEQGPASIRPLPASIAKPAQHDQLQQLLPLSAQGARAMVGRRAIVYWPDEAQWYNGIVSAAQASPAALKIGYDDGDSRWEQEHTFNCILLLRATSGEPKAPLPSIEVVHAGAPPSSPERVLYARPYRQVVHDHLQPVRIARPYRCVVEKHSNSVIIARHPYSERRFLHAVHTSLECSRLGQSLLVDKADNIAQTELLSSLTES
ncbi:hypothetical protein PHYPSEUDO_000053 [Phytophthora pseudosyringae]|uniref:Tudor domain-containing protein n=1 Tax=Phytophthora pseudosyringae TaxID=221518 RepID=A0A8T1WKD9_9STRA|nr:hypothetical protein PHYPSEUDO_000053 [Phytophthora pseudosyringae]